MDSQQNVLKIKLVLRALLWLILTMALRRNVSTSLMEQSSGRLWDCLGLKHRQVFYPLYIHIYSSIIANHDQNYCYKNLKSSDKRYSGYLASIHTSTEAKQLQDKLLVAGQWWNFWIGLRQTCDNCNWSWNDNSPIDFEAWKDGEPNNAGDGEDCVTVLSVDKNNMAEQIHYGGWNDDRCSKPYSFVCELFPEGTPWSQQTITYPTGTGTGINDQRSVFCHTWAGSDGLLISEKVFLPFG